MIVRIVQDIQVFLAILFALVLGFTQSCYLIGPDYNKPDRFPIYMWQSFTGMINGFDAYTVTQNSSSPPLAFLFTTWFILFIVIILLNFLIALMGDSFNKASETALAEWRLTQAGILLEIAEDGGVGAADLPPYVQLLMYTADRDAVVKVNNGGVAGNTSNTSAGAASNSSSAVASSGGGDDNTAAAAGAGGNGSSDVGALSDRMERMEQRLEHLASTFDKILAKLE
jgi:hypothetical protein